MEGLNNKNFAHLHIHNEYSLLDGYGKAEQYAKKAKAMGFEHIALTNHGNVDGAIKWQEEMEKVGIHPIMGAELYMVPDRNVKEKGEKRYHVNLLCRNGIGWKNLLKMISISNLEGFYYRPRIDPETLIENCEGLIVMSACIGSFTHMETDVAFNLIRTLQNKGVPVLLEIMPNKFPGQKEHNKAMLELSEVMNIPLVATNDCHYIDRENAELQEVMLAMQTHKKWADPERWKFDVDTLYLKSVDEMYEGLKDIGIPEVIALESVARTIDVANMCSLKIKKKKVRLPRPPIRDDIDKMPDDDALYSLTIEGLEDRIAKHPEMADKYDEYTDRIADELSTIINLGFSRYFLIVYELIHWCQRVGIMTGPGRGSVGGCLVAYCLGITQVDPIKYNLIFSRFISEARIDLPDIDMDFEDIKRPMILEHLKDIYGEYNVIGLSTFAVMRGKGAIRDVSRVFDVPIVEVNKAAECIVTRSGGDARSDYSIKDAFDTFEDGKVFKTKYPKVCNIAMALEGQVKGCGRHAAAMCVSQFDLRNGLNSAYVMRSKTLTANWDKVDAEYMGLMKLDVLGLNALTILNECKRLIIESGKKMIIDGKKTDFDFYKIPMDDPKVFEGLTAGHGIGVFQFNTQGAMRICREIGVEDFEEMIAINALNRPGTLRSGMIPIYKRRKTGEEETTYLHSYIENITKDTYGIILYQEQIMHLMHDLGGLQWKTTDMIRKVISKSKGEEQFDKFKKMFIDGCIERKTVSEKEAETIFEELKYFGSYGFNRSHAAEYSMIGYWQMWLKIHFTTEFLVAYLSYGPTHEDKKKEIIAECKRLGLKIALPDINKSLSKEWTADDNVILTPFQEIKGVGPTAADVIVKLRDEGGPYKDEEDLLKRLEDNKLKSKCNSRVRKLLNELGCWETTEDRLESKTEEELEKLSEYFNFNLSNDPMYRYRKMIKRISEKLDMTALDCIVGPELQKDVFKFHFGLIDVLKFGFKDRANKKMTDLGGDQTAKDFGGVYAYFKDDTDYITLTFGGDLYKNKKNEIEHCEGEWLLAKAQCTKNEGNIHTNEIWFGNDLLQGKASGLGIDLARTVQDQEIRVLIDHFQNKDINNCDLCELRKECNKPVWPSVGSFNISIVGEAPGFNEDKSGAGFVGDAGELLWGTRTLRGLKGLLAYGFDRSNFHITNICKCYPKKTKTPKKKHIKACGSNYLDVELATIKPFVILAFGNTGLKFFKSQDTGIMDLSGTTEWSDKYNCWICYSSHPASALYSPDSVGYLHRGIENFVSVISDLGFGL